MPNLFGTRSTTGKARASNNADVRAQYTSEGAAYTADWIRMLAMEGRVYNASDGAATETTTGQITQADTLATLILRVPSGTTCIPLGVKLVQTGTVAGGFITCSMEYSATDPYASSGTTEKSLCSRTDAPNGAATCTLISTPILTTGNFGIVLAAYTINADIGSASATNQGPQAINWRASEDAPLFLVGPASFKVYTYAGTTGPTWIFNVQWAEIPTTSIN